MTRLLPCALVAGCLAVASPSSALDPLRDWVDGCQATDPDLQALLEHDALIVTKQALVQNPSGTWRVNTQAFTQLIKSQAPAPPLVLDYCPQGRFYGQPQVIRQSANADDLVRRSAVQVGPDLVLTTWHNPFAPQYLPDFRVVFGLYARNVGGLCVFPDFENIPASQVYTPVAVAADGWDEGLDMLLLRLDRTVSETYPRVRRSGRGWPNDSVTLIGHPQRLAAKVDRAGKAGKIQIFDEREWLDTENLHGLPDSSGSMVYNRTQRVLETTAKQGLGATDEWVPAQSCYVVAHLPGFRSQNATLRYFAQHIPAFELLVESLDPVIHVAALGGPINPSNARTVKAPLTADGSIDYQIVPPGPAAPGAPSLSIVASGPLTGTLSPGAQLTVRETANIHGVTCGFHERSYEIRDLTHGFVDLARQVFEIGIREFAVGGFGRVTIEDLAYPFEDEVEYPISNPRPTPVVVRVKASVNWLRLDQEEPGGAGDPPAEVDVLVEPHGSVVLKAGIAAWAQSLPYSLPNTHYVANISFEVAPGDPCPTVGGTVTREIDFAYGTETIAGPGGVIPPGSQNSLLVEADVNENFCVDDVNLEINTAGLLSSDLTARLTSPPEIRDLVWNRGTLTPPGPLRGTLDDEGALHPFSPLSVFDGTGGEGIWKLRLTNAGDLSGAEPTLNSWSLQLKARHCP